MTFAPAPEYHVFPTQRAAAQALRGGRAWRRARRCRSSSELRPHVRRRRHPHARAGAGRRDGGRAGRRRSSPTSTRGRRRAARRTRWARGCRGRALGPRDVAARGPTASSPRGCEQGRAGAQRDAPAPRAARRSAASHGGISPRAVPGRDAPPARVPARLAGAGRARRRAAAVGAAGRAGVEPPAGRRARRSCSSRRRRRRTPSTGCCARRSRVSPTSRCACSATWNRREPDPPLDVPDERRLVDWLSYAQTMPRVRRRRLPRRARDGRARAGERLRGRRAARRPAT